MLAFAAELDRRPNRIGTTKSAWHHISGRTGVQWDWSVSGSLVIRSKPAVTVRIGDYIVSTARNRALPSATRS
jgi:hypothetical protein